jgi:hypothetical protein
MDLDLLLHLHRALNSPQPERMPISERELVVVSRLDEVNGSEMVIEGDIFTPWGRARDMLSSQHCLEWNEIPIFEDKSCVYMALVIAQSSLESTTSIQVEDCTASMYAVVISVSFLSFLVYYFVISPVWLYLRDPKGFRKYPAMNALAGITDLGFMYEATKGFRTKHLTELHKKYPVVRIGPNSLSFSGVQAIKVSPLPL